MRYRKGFKCQLASPLLLQTRFRPVNDIQSDFCLLKKSGELYLLKGFAWDGPSGPVIDRSTNMRASGGHDALYRMMRKKQLDCGRWRLADKCFGDWMREDGAWNLTVKIYLFGLSLAKGSAANPKNKKQVYEV